jgi:hypothetical protein
MFSNIVVTSLEWEYIPLDFDSISYGSEIYLRFVATADMRKRDQNIYLQTTELSNGNPEYFKTSTPQFNQLCNWHISMPPGAGRTGTYEQKSMRS